MSLINIDDCIEKIYIDENIQLYLKPDNICHTNHKNFPEPILNQIPYDIGQKIYVIVGDIGGDCKMKLNIQVNNKNIADNRKFWHCIDCNGNISGEEANVLRCFNVHRDYEYKNYTFYFQINSIDELDFGISEYSYYLTKQNYFYISPLDLNGTIDLINLNISEILYAKNDKETITPYYDYICYKLVFDQLFSYKGKFIGTDKEDNDIELNETICSSISQIKQLRYELSETEKNNNGVHIRLKIGIYNYQNKQVSDLEDFNFFVCLNGYQFCDIETSMKCLNEGYYQLNNRNYSCYETCKNCDVYKKPDNANYFKNYCDLCKSNFPFYVNNEKMDEYGPNINYKSCYEKCPYHAPQLKFLDDNECVSYCPRYKTSEGICLDYCDYNSCKYLLKNESICYNYIPSNYYICIDDYNDIYHDNDKPIIKIKEECPDVSYDSSFKYFCIKFEEDIFHLIENPNDLIRYSNPMIKNLKTKQMIIRAYSSDKIIDDIDNNKNKKIRIDISLCEQKIKQYYSFSNDEKLIIQDVFNIETEKYLYKVFTKEGEELNINVCESDDISIKEIYYSIEKEHNITKCPSGYPYLDLNKDICLKSCDIMSFLDKSCITDVITEENQINNINNIKKSIESHSIDYLLDNITNGAEDIIIEEENITYQLSSTLNQNNNNYTNISNILLGKCETDLKEKYNISLNTSLLFFKVDVYIDGYSSPIVEYEVYNPITKEKLDLKFCENERINTTIPASINESELYKYNPKSEFYNDLCSTYTTKTKTDITLNDRQNEFLENNMSLCDTDCNYVSYDYILKKAECECKVKFRIKDLYEVKIDKEKLKMKFNIKNLVNIKVMKCFKKLFNRNSLLYNIGSYILLAIIFIYLICLIYLRFKDFYSLKIEIKNYFDFLKNENDFKI